MDSSPQPLRIQLQSMRQLAEAKQQEDDWTGITDAAARRRAQTRLNTRAYRKRKAAEKAEADRGTKSESSEVESEASPSRAPAKPATASTVSEPMIQCWDVHQDSLTIVPAYRVSHLLGLPSSRRPPLLPLTNSNDRNPAIKPTPASTVLQGQLEKPRLIFPLTPDHLITLQQYNALRALAVNRTLVSGILTTPLDCTPSSDLDGEIIHTIPYPSSNLVATIPPSLLPTLLQQTIPHPDWIDLFPSPQGRDRLIRQLLLTPDGKKTFDEDELWNDCIGGLYEGYPEDEIERRGVVAWSPPWDVSGWEMSEGFVKKWGWLLAGFAPGFLEATNAWRARRGEDPIFYESREVRVAVEPGS